MQAFLDALYGDVPDELWWYIWTLSPTGAKYTHWFAGADTACAADLCAKAQSVNVYYPIGLTSERGNEHQRATVEQITAIIGLVADIDFKPRGCPTERAALDVLEHLPLQPTYLIHSGHGLQCGWLFKEPWTFDDDAERADAQNLALAWGYTVADHYNRAGYELDPVHDLTRVMRVPGTRNVKAEPVPCELRWLENNRRYNPGDVEPLCVEVPRATMRERALPSVDVSADFPREKHDLLLAEHEDYRATWEHKRKDLNADCSRHDMALATFAAQVGWTDDEITAMLIEHRKHWGRDKPEKLRRADYYARTIHKARQTADEYTAQNQAAQVIEDNNAPREQVLRALADRWEIPLTRIERVTGDPAIYRFWVGGRVAEIEAPRLVSQSQFLGEILSVANYYPRAVAPKERPTWRDLVNRVAACADTIDGGDDTTRDGALLSVLHDMFDERGVVSLDDVDGIMQTGGIFEADGYVWFSLSELVQKCKLVGMDGRPTQKGLAQRLRAIGAVDKQWSIRRHDGKYSAKRFWGVRNDPSSITQP